MYQVFRVEHKETGKGPFQTSDPFTQKLAWRLQDFPNLPAPEHDGLPIGMIPMNFVFGCLSLSTLSQWFLLEDTACENENIVTGLKLRGYVLRKYEAHPHDCRTSYSGLQIAFDSVMSSQKRVVEEYALSMLLSTEAATT